MNYNLLSFQISGKIVFFTKHDTNWKIIGTSD